MDTQTRHWYLQQMGIPVWVPRGSESPAEMPAAQSLSTAQPVMTEALASDAAKQENSGLSPAQQIAQNLRAGTADEARLPHANEPPAVAADAAAAAAQSGTQGTALAFWLVMPNIPAPQKAAAEDLLDKILAAVEVDKSKCYLLWDMPTQLPPASVKHLWCFGLQAPPGLPAKTLELPSLAEMLNNVEAKRAAWNALKAAMPFSD